MKRRPELLGNQKIIAAVDPPDGAWGRGILSLCEDSSKPPAACNAESQRLGHVDAALGVSLQEHALSQSGSILNKNRKFGST